MFNQNNSEFELFHFFERTLDFVCVASKEGFFKYINPAVINKLGYTKEELFSRPIASFIHPDDKERTSRTRTEMLNGKPLTDFDNRYITKTGDIIWLHWTSVYFPDKEIVFAIAKDVTQRKLTEKEIEEKYKKFKSSATHFKASLEKDKRFLAVELHEELAQLASVIKMDIDWINNNSTDLNEMTKKRIDHALSVSDLLINSIRRISYSISPAMLEDIGLNDTLEWLCQEFSVLNGIPCFFVTSIDDNNLLPEIKLDLYRICQEALSNIMYHAQASNVNIKIENIDDEICLTITDDGKGFEMDKLKKLPGLTDMRERASSVNGKLKIESKPGLGTSICVSIAQQLPVNNN